MYIYLYIILLMLFGLNTGIYSQNQLDIQKINCSYKVKKLEILDSNLYLVLDSVLVSERASNRFFTDSTHFGIWVSISGNPNLNYLSIIGSDIRRLFIESESLVGFFKYNEHYFFVMNNYPTLFSETKAIQNFKINSFDKEISEDDRWHFYYFAYDGKNFHQILKNLQ